MTDLSILCVTRFAAHARPFIGHLQEAAIRLRATFILGADAPLPDWIPVGARTRAVPLSSAGYIESVLDQAVLACPAGYVLRVDDDETLSSPLLAWLEDGSYEQADHWAFPRMHLWPDEHRYIVNEPLFPDLQTRLSVREKAGGRSQIHVGSPYGTGRVAEGCPILHHKFLARSYDERARLLRHYDSVLPGAGEQFFAAFSLPERYAPDLRFNLVPA